jgi:hypothetical protein
MPFDQIMVLSNADGLTALSNVEGLRLVPLAAP